MHPIVNSHSPIAPYNNQSYEPTFLSPRHLNDISCWVDRNGLTQPSYTFPANPHEISYWYDKYDRRYYIHYDDKDKEIIRDVNGYIHFQYRMHTYNQTPQYSGMHQLCIPGASLPSSLSRPIANFHTEQRNYTPRGNSGYFNSHLGSLNDSLSHQHRFNSLRSSGPESFSSMYPKPKLHSMVSPRAPEDDDDECVSGKSIKGKPKPVKKSNSDLMSEIASANLIIANDDENSLLLLNQLLQLVRKEQKNTAINIYTIELAAFLKLIGESSIAEDTAHKLGLSTTIIEKLNGFLKLETVDDIKNLSYLELQSFEKPILKKLLQFEKLIKKPYTLESIFAFFNLYQLPPNLQRENYTIISLLELVNYKGFEIITAIRVLNEMKLYEIKHPVSKYDREYKAICATHPHRCHKAEFVPLSSIFLEYYKDNGFNGFGSVTCDDCSHQTRKNWKNIFHFNKITGHTKFNISSKVLISHCPEHEKDMCWYCVESYQELHIVQHTNLAQQNSSEHELSRRQILEEENRKALEKQRVLEQEYAASGISNTPSENSTFELNQVLEEEKLKAIEKQRILEEGVAKCQISSSAIEKHPSTESINSLNEDEWTTPPPSLPAPEVLLNAKNTEIHQQAVIKKVQSANSKKKEHNDAMTESKRIEIECQICFEDYSDKFWRVMIMPCGHARFCNTCVDKISTFHEQSPTGICPFCKVPFTSVYRVFL